MDETFAIVTNTARRLLADLSTRAAVWEDMTEDDRSAGWREIEESGFLVAMIAEEHGGLGLSLGQSLQLAGVVGQTPLPWPIVETMLARRFASATGNKQPLGPVERLEDLSPRNLHIAAAARAVQMAGGLEAMLAITIAHVQERSQFGRPLAQFQAVQHSLAVLAGEVAAARASADLAVERLDDDGETNALAVGIARARVGEAVSKGSAIAHQLHGAIGYTREHRLHRYTTAMFAWRDEFGTQTWWTRLVGRAVLANGRDGLWPMVTAA